MMIFLNIGYIGFKRLVIKVILIMWSIIKQISIVLIAHNISKTVDKLLD